jgi:hypothetical protein
MLGDLSPMHGGGGGCSHDNEGLFVRFVGLLVLDDGSLSFRRSRRPPSPTTSLTTTSASGELEPCDASLDELATPGARSGGGRALGLARGSDVVGMGAAQACSDNIWGSARATPFLGHHTPRRMSIGMDLLVAEYFS